LEWAFLPMLEDRSEASPVVLHRALANSPDFFIQLICEIFRPRNRSEEDNEEEISDDRRKKAESGYRLLKGWRIIPGTTEGEETVISFDSLKKWFIEMKDLAETADRLEVAGSIFGETLAHAPDGSDSVWPCEPVRKLLEEHSYDSIWSGLHCGIVNKRGAYFVDGGRSEREIAEKYNRWATACAIKWPNVADFLRRMRDDYISQAKHYEGEEEFRRD
ncbi:MAG: hypothetical protein AAF585_10520, partial [Verrucomicrobiota bacterium]